MAVISTVAGRDDDKPARRLPSSEIRTLPIAGRQFLTWGSPRVLLAGLIAAVAVRAGFALGPSPFALGDALAIGLVALLVPFVEWFVHRFVLHFRPRTVGGMTLDPGAGHRQHHLNPASTNWVVLRAVDALLFQAINAGFAVVVVGGAMIVLDRPPVGPALTGIVAAMAALAHYEWAHYLFHVAYRPKSRFYRRLKANHRLHHWRNEYHWLGITSNVGDRVLRTLPRSKTAVPASPTARTLESNPAEP